MGTTPIPPIPPSSAIDGEAYKLRYLAEAPPPPKEPREYGDWSLALVIMILGILILAGGVLVAYVPISVPVVQIAVPVSVSNISVEGESCSAYQTGIAHISFTLTDSGSQNARVTLEFFVNGVDAGSNVYNVSAKQSVPEDYWTSPGFCNPTSANVQVLEADAF